MNLLDSEQSEMAGEIVLAVLRADWIGLKALMAQLPPAFRAPSIGAQIIGDLQRRGLVQTRKANGTIQIRKTK